MEIARKIPDELKCFKKDLSQYGQILLVELSPHVLSQDLILVGFQNSILLGHLKVDETLEFESIAEYSHEARPTCISISPEASISILPNFIHFATGGNDYKVRIYKSDLKGDDVCLALKGHSSYVNDVKFDPDNAYVVSVSDDNTARLWETSDYSCVGILRLSSPGMSACWHREDNSKLLIGEKIGLIRFYNVETQCPILSLDCGRPLSGAHWAPSDAQLVASLQLGEMLVWDMTKPCIPISSSLIFTEPGGMVRFSPFAELIAAVNTLESTLKIVHVRNQQLKLSVSLRIPSNCSWHCRSPIVSVGDYTTLLFYKVPSK